MTTVGDCRSVIKGVTFCTRKTKSLVPPFQRKHKQIHNYAGDCAVLSTAGDQDRELSAPRSGYTLCVWSVSVPVRLAVSSMVAPVQARGPAVIMKTGPMHARESLQVKKKLLTLSIIQQTNSYQCSPRGSITAELLVRLAGFAH